MSSTKHLAITLSNGCVFRGQPQKLSDKEIGQALVSLREIMADGSWITIDGPTDPEVLLNPRYIVCVNVCNGE